MKASILLISLTMALSTSLNADSSAIAKRDAALKGINACLHRNWVPSRECKNLNKNIQTLEDLYRQGDETVLPTLFRFTYLTDFFGESLIAHPDAFLSAMSRLSEPAQQAVETGIAGRMFGIADPRFTAIRATLTSVPVSSPVYLVARQCLHTIDRYNAIFIVDYFPPQIFTRDPRDLMRRWYSNELYSLGENPLSSYSSDPAAEIYRLMILPTWGNAIAVRIQRHGELYTLSARRLDGQAGYDPGQLVETKEVNLNMEDSKTLETLIQHLRFFELPTDDTVLGMDGYGSLLEGVSHGKYHAVDRWSATYNAQKRGLTAFVELSKFLVRKSALSKPPMNKGFKIFK